MRRVTATWQLDPVADTEGACHVACSTPKDAWWSASLFGMIGTASAKPIKGSTDPNNPST